VNDYRDAIRGKTRTRYRLGGAVTIENMPNDGPKIT
jgi:hypothetical protein